MTRNLVPTENSTQNLGRAGKRWKKGYIDSLVGITGEKDVDALALKTEVAEVKTEVAEMRTLADKLAPLASPQFTGAPTAPTAEKGASDGRLATTGFVVDEIRNQVLGNSDFKQTVNDIVGLDSALAAKAPIHSPGLTGSPTAPTPGVGDSSNRLATTAFIKAQGYVTAEELGELDDTPDMSSRSINTASPLTGGGSLANDLHLRISDATTAAKGATMLSSSVTSNSEAEAATPKAVKTAYDLAASKASATHTHTVAIADVSGLQASLDAKTTITYGTADLVANSSALTTGTVYLVYE